MCVHHEFCLIGMVQKSETLAVIDHVGETVKYEALRYATDLRLVTFVNFGLQWKVQIDGSLIKLALGKDGRPRLRQSGQWNAIRRTNGSLKS